jgi:hypothetical protein
VRESRKYASKLRGAPVSSHKPEAAIRKRREDEQG